MGSLNHSYRLVWNEICGAFVAVPEFARGRGKRTGGTVRRAMAASIVGAAAAALAGPAFALDPGALPTGAQVTAGQAAMSQQGSQLRIDQTTNKLIVNWNSFDIGSNASVRFNQTGADAVALNRVTGGAPSQIFGDLSANGQVWLVNNSGVVFGKGATVNVSGLVASTLNVSDADFLAGRARFTGTSAAQVRNEGAIRADGVVALLGASVVNTGSISAGQVAMAAGQSVSLDFSGDGLLQVQVDQAALDAELSQQGLIQGDKVVLSAPSASALRASVINMDGVIEAKGLSAQGGRIVLDGGEQGQVNITGRLDATSAQGQGGDIRVTGGDITLRGATLDASGATGGGQIHVGGGWQGNDASLINAKSVSVDAASKLSANGTVNGNGGEVVAWSDGQTQFAGRVEARGGDQGGNGGRMEVSGKEQLNYSGVADGRAAKGNTGDLLLDPATLEVRGGGSGTGAINGSVVYEKDLESQLANIILEATTDVTFKDLKATGSTDGILDLKDGVSLTVVAGRGGQRGSDPRDKIGVIRFEQKTDTIRVNGNAGILLIASNWNSSGSDLINGASASVINVPHLVATGTGSNPSGALPTYDLTTATPGAVQRGTITVFGANGITIGGSVTTQGGYVRLWADADSGTGGSFTLNAPITSNGGNVYLASGSGGITMNGAINVGTGRLFFDRETGTYPGGTGPNGPKTLAGQINATGDIDINTAFTMKGGASIYTDGTIRFGAVNLNLDTGTGVLTLRADKVDWGSATLSNLSTASLRLEPANAATNMVLGDANGFASAATLAKLPGIKNLTIGRADGTGTISVASNFSFNASGSFELVDRNIDISAGTLTNTTGNVTLTGDNVSLSKAVTANGGNGKVTIRQMTAGNELHLGGGLSSASIGQVNAASLEIGRVDGGDLVFDSDITTNATTVHLKSGGKVIGVDGGVAAANLAVTAGGGATLTDDTFNFGKLALDTGGTTLIRQPAAGGFATGTVDSLSGLTLRNGADVTLDSGIGALMLGGPVNFTGTAAKLTLKAPTWITTGSPASSNGSLATVVFQAAGSAAQTTVGGTSADITNNMLSVFNGVNTLRVDASDRALNVTGTVAVNVGGRLELLGNTWNQAGSIGVTTGGLLVRAGAGGINVAQSMTATGTVSLDDRSGAGISGNAAITANALALRSSGTAALNANQHINQLAADVGSLTLVADRALTVGTVDGLSGVHTGGTVQLAAIGASSDLTLQQAVTADNVGGAARGTVLVAGRNFINQAGATALQVGNNGAWQVYSTSPLNDTRGGLGADFKQYDAGYGSAVLGTGNGFLYTVAPTLNLTLTGPVTKVYDGNATATVDTSALQASGAIDGDVVHLGVGAGGSASYDNKNVGTGKTVSLSGVVINDAANGGTAVYGYRLASTTASAAVGVVTPKTVTAVGSVQDKVYDGTTSAQLNGGGFTGLVSGDDAALSGSVHFVDKNAGTAKAVDVTGLSLTGSDAANYVLDTGAGATAAITPKGLGIGSVVVSDKVYDGTRGASVTTSGTTGIVAGDDLGVSASGQFADKNAGNGKSVDVQLSLSGADAGNYTIANPTGTTASITPKALGIGSVVVSDKVYDGTRGASVTTSGTTGIVAGDHLGVSASGQFADKNAGNGKSVDVQLALSGADAGNYTIANPTGQTASITPKALGIGSVTVGDKVYDGTRGASVTTSGTTGIVAGDDLGVSASGQFADKNAGNGKSVDVQLSLSGADAGNYTIANPTGQTASITPKALGIGSVTVGDKVYDGTRGASVTTSGTTGIVAGDDLGVSASGQFADKNAGKDKAVDVQLALKGADAGNYTIANPTGKTASITPKTVDVNAITVAGKVYDGTRDASVTTGGAVGAVAGDDLIVAASGQYSDKNAGTGKAVDVKLGLTGADAGNYQLATGSKQSTGDITARTIQAPTVSVVGATFNGGTSATVVTGAPQGVLAGDQVSVKGSGNFDSPYVGNGKTVNVQLQLQGADAGNYKLDTTQVTSTGAVTPLVTPPAVDGLVSLPVGGNGTQGGDGNSGSKTANVPTGNGGNGGGAGSTVASVAAGPSGNTGGTVALGDLGTGSGNGNGANAGTGSIGGNGTGLAGNGNGTSGNANGTGTGAGNGANSSGSGNRSAGNGSPGNGVGGLDGNGSANGASNGANGANGSGPSNGSGNGGNTGANGGNTAGNGNANTAGGDANGAGNGNGNGNGNGAGQGNTGVALASLSLEQTLSGNGQVSLAVDAPAYDQARQSQLPVYADRGEPVLQPLGMFRVDDLGDSLALKPLQQPVPATDRTSTGVTRQVRASVALDGGRSTTLDVVLMADGTLRVQAPDAAAALSDDLVAALALSALKQQTGVAPTSVRAVMLRRGG
ncbi:YDG domain-containing protein [Roseateles sp.]|uniref:YDG domain-containing protein n=1 Tax=Roseateles sp. TaxID=1971397 RepID=UPI0031D5AC27